MHVCRMLFSLLKINNDKKTRHGSTQTELLSKQIEEIGTITTTRAKKRTHCRITTEYVTIFFRRWKY